ncbi:type II toxin-antitoxin system RelE/ParE family toxin [Rickettsia tamurae]|uniref:Addiction module toxin, Txe/YoeB family n=2 Tax=Rickettsia tamurae TaxID=334545 RepID=A0A8E1C0S7_9RICK|nr:type II toxin-antitoxin system YoeB family toxin [Rickettsia tamurae]KDO03743.1 addiction module toxin, Txe/YoeB family [Rickettsia tamurae subsp. buchneri]
MPLNSKKLYRNLVGKRSIRINLQHRLVYEILEDKKIIKILSMWGHYE